MGRYRPPQKPGSKYITPEGFQRLNDELSYLWKIKRPRVTQAVREAAAQGDRSENAEYIYGKKQLREIDHRVRFLRKRLENITVVDTLPGDTQRIYFGAWVELENMHGKILRYRIVGPDEFDAQRGFISMDSPVAQALMRKSVDDIIVVNTPEGDDELCITAVYYDVHEKHDDQTQ